MENGPQSSSETKQQLSALDLVTPAILCRACIRTVPALGYELRVGPSFSVEPPNDIVLGAFRALSTATVVSVQSEKPLEQRLALALKHSCFLDDASHGFQDHGNSIDSIRALGEFLLSTPDEHDLAKLLHKISNSAYGENAISCILRDQSSLKSFRAGDQAFNVSGNEVHSLPLWLSEHLEPDELSRDTKEFRKNNESANNIWNYWLEWYQGFVNDRPLDWELQRRVALIDDAIWDAGPEAVAAEIKRIRAEFRVQPAGKERFPKHEPKSVNHLIENRVVAAASLLGLSSQISDAVLKFTHETGANALPDALEPLAAMPPLLDTLARTLRGLPPSDKISTAQEQQLKEENGRLNAKIAELQSTIAALRAEVMELNAQTAALSVNEKKSYLSFLKRVALIGSLVGIAPTLAGGAWALSGDELGVKQRYENLASDWEFIRDLFSGEISPSDGLPQTQVEKSLRPAARPGRA